MTTDEAEDLQRAVANLQGAAQSLSSQTWAGVGEDPQLVERAEAYLAAEREHEKVLTAIRGGAA